MSNDIEEICWKESGGVFQVVGFLIHETGDCVCLAATHAPEGYKDIFEIRKENVIKRRKIVFSD